MSEPRVKAVFGANMTVDEEEDAAELKEERHPVTDEWKPNFHWLADDLAIGGCFPMERARHVAEIHGIAAVVDLRAEFCDDERLLEAAGISFLHLPTPDLEPARHEDLERGVEFVREQVRLGRKVLIHCQHGIGRSALLCLCVLVDRGLEPLEALIHAKERRELISPSRSQYEGWASWLRSRGVEAPDYHRFGCIAYRHLAQG